MIQLMAFFFTEGSDDRLRRKVSPPPNRFVRFPQQQVGFREAVTTGKRAVRDGATRFFCHELMSGVAARPILSRVYAIV